MRILGSLLLVVLGAPAVRAQRPPPDPGPFTVRGIVRDSSDRPIQGATITVYGATSSATSDRKGEFALSSLPGGTHVFQAIALGFKPRLTPVTISSRMGIVEIEMIGTTIVLDSVVTNDRPDVKVEIVQRRQNVISAA